MNYVKGDLVWTTKGLGLVEGQVGDVYVVAFDTGEEIDPDLIPEAGVLGRINYSERLAALGRLITGVTHRNPPQPQSGGQPQSMLPPPKVGMVLPGP